MAHGRAGGRWPARPHSRLGLTPLTGTRGGYLYMHCVRDVFMYYLNSILTNTVKIYLQDFHTVLCSRHKGIAKGGSQGVLLAGEPTKCMHATMSEHVARMDAVACTSRARARARFYTPKKYHAPQSGESPEVGAPPHGMVRSRCVAQQRSAPCVAALRFCLISISL